MGSQTCPQTPQSNHLQFFSSDFCSFPYLLSTPALILVFTSYPSFPTRWVFIGGEEEDFSHP